MQSNKYQVGIYDLGVGGDILLGNDGEARSFAATSQQSLADSGTEDVREWPESLSAERSEDKAVDPKGVQSGEIDFDQGAILVQTGLDHLPQGRGGNPGPGGGGSGGGGGGDNSSVWTATYVSGAQDSGSDDFFNIEVRFFGDLWSDGLFDAFIASADFLSSIISVGLNDDFFVSSFSGDLAELAVDDLVIEARIANIDGTGGVLGQAGPTYARSSSGTTIDGLPTAGIMEFDGADAASLFSDSLWDDTVLHEMMHVLGFGTLWDLANWALVGTQKVVIDDNGTRKPNDDVSAYKYLGDANNDYGDTFIPVESDGGSGTARGHWDEQLLQNEIMTGYINQTNYLADFTVAALADLGYGLASSDYADLASPLADQIALSAVGSDVLLIA